MIVISGALVLVALVLLVIGLVSTSLGFVYASIAVSVVSFVFLLIGILQRRGEQVPGTAGDTATTAPVVPVPATTAAGSDAEVEGVTTILPGSTRAEDTAATEATVLADAPAGGTNALSGSVLVVPGRPRYHVSGCRYLTGKDPEEVDVQQARSEGYTACGVCKPDATLSEEAAAQPHPQPDEPVPAAEPAAQADSELVGAAAPDPVQAARRTTRATPTTSPGRTPAKRAAAKAPAGTATKAPAKAAAKKAPAKAASGGADKTATVVVIPDRGKFHRADCRFVRDADDTKEMSRTAASRQGYAACGVCKP